MKNLNLIFCLLTVFLAFTVSCTKTEQDSEPGTTTGGGEDNPVPQDAAKIRFSISSASDGQGKATLNEDDGYGYVTWNEGDEVTVYAVGGEETLKQTVEVSEISDDGMTAVVETTELPGGLTYYAVFPADENATISNDAITVSMSEQDGTGNNKRAVAKAEKKTEGYSLLFRNVCSLLKFEISTNLASTINKVELVGQDGKKISYDKVTYNFDGSSSSSGTEVKSIERDVTAAGTYYITLAPGVKMANGFMLKLYKDNKVEKLFFKDGSFTTKTNTITEIENFETKLYTNLSKDETANCYLINPPGTNGNKLFCFDATVAGNGVPARSTGDVTSLATASVSHLWSTLNTSTKPTSNSIVKSVTYHMAGYASFEYVSTGNVIVAARDSEETIIWSWHLWLPVVKVEPVVHTNALYVKNMLNANLGALTRYIEGEARDLGFFYQWGRKDPFVSSSSKTSVAYAKVQGTAKTTVARAEINTGGQARLNKTIQDPTCFITTVTGEYTGRDWYGTGSTAPVKFWSVDKTMYDPCPPGYKVPRVQEGPWRLLSGTGSKWSSTHKALYYDNDSGVRIFFPAAGFLDRSTGNYKSGTLGVEGGYWGIDDGYERNDTRRGKQFYNYYWYFTYDSSEKKNSCAFNYDDDSHQKDKSTAGQDTFTGTFKEQNAGRATGRSVRCCKSTEQL